LCEIVDVVMGKTELIMNIAVIFAGGVGKRMNSKVEPKPKQFITIQWELILRK